MPRSTAWHNGAGRESRFAFIRIPRKFFAFGGLFIGQKTPPPRYFTEGVHYLLFAVIHVPKADQSETPFSRSVKQLLDFIPERVSSICASR